MQCPKLQTSRGLGPIYYFIYLFIYLFQQNSLKNGEDIFIFFIFLIIFFAIKYVYTCLWKQDNSDPHPRPCWQSSREKNCQNNLSRWEYLDQHIPDTGYETKLFWHYYNTMIDSSRLLTYTLWLVEFVYVSSE